MAAEEDGGGLAVGEFLDDHRLVLCGAEGHLPDKLGGVEFLAS